MPRLNATASVERAFVSTRTRTDSSYTELRGVVTAKNPFDFAHLLAALAFMQRGPLEIVFAGDRAEPALLPLVETVHRSYHPSRVVAFAERCAGPEAPDSRSRIRTNRRGFGSFPRRSSKQ